MSAVLGHLGVLGLVLAFVGVRLYYRWTWKPEQRQARAIGREKLLTTFVTFSLFVPPLTWVSTGWPSALGFEPPLGIRLGGLLLGLAGVLVVERAHRALAENFSPRLDLRPDHTLVVGGPYRFVRHPMYLGGILFSTGILLCSANLLAGAPLLMAMLLLLLLRLPDEERMLKERFGASWDAYAARSGRVLPRFSGP